MVRHLKIGQLFQKLDIFEKLKKIKFIWKKLHFNFEVAQIWREIIFEGGLVWRKLGLHGPPPLLFYFENLSYFSPFDFICFMTAVLSALPCVLWASLSVFLSHSATPTLQDLFTSPTSPYPLHRLPKRNWPRGVGRAGPPGLADGRTLTFLWSALFCSVTRLVSPEKLGTTYGEQMYWVKGAKWTNPAG